MNIKILRTLEVRSNPTNPPPRSAPAVKNRVGAFPDVFSSTNSRFNVTESRSEPRVRFRLATGEVGNFWCMFVKNIFITSMAVVRIVYYIRGPCGDENIFAVLYVSLCYGPYTLL